MLRFVCRFTQFSFLFNFNDGVLPPPTPFIRWGHFNFEKLKSFGGRAFFHHMGGQVHMGNTVIMVTKGEEGGHNSGQNNYHTIAFFFKKKQLFYDHFQRKKSFDFYIISFKTTYVNFSLMMNSWGKCKLIN